MKKSFDIGIVGLGITGASLASKLTQNGIKVIAIDNKNQPRFASSYGESRLFRVLHNSRSLSSICNNTLNELQKFTEQQNNFFINCGHINIIPEEHLSFYKEQLQEFKLAFRVFSKQQLLQFNKLHISDNEVAIFEPSSGYIIPSKFIDTLLEHAKSNGATIIRNNKILVDFETNSIHLDGNSYDCDFLLLATGSNLQNSLNNLGYHNDAKLFKTIYQNTFFVNQDLNLYKNTWYNFSNLNYGFPFLPNEGNRIGISSFMHTNQNKLEQIEYNSLPIKKLIVNAINHPEINLDNLNISKRYSGVFTKLSETNTNRNFIFKPLNNTLGYIFSCGGHGFKMSLNMAATLSKEIQEFLN